MVCDTGRVSYFSLPWWSLQFARQANQINNVQPKEASGNAGSWEKTGNKSCVFSVLLLYVTAVTDCHLWPGAASFFFYQTLELTKTDPNLSGFQIPGKDFRDNFPHSWEFPSVFGAAGAPKDLSTLVVESQVPKQEIDSLWLHCASLFF